MPDAKKPANLSELEVVANRKVLAIFGRTLFCVQSFESTLKAILLVHKTFIAASKGLVQESTFEKLLEEPRSSTLGSALKDLRKSLKPLNYQPFPEKMDKLLVDLVSLRNWLAHSYLIDNSDAFTTEEGREGLIAELKWYAEMYLTMHERLDRWLVSLLQQLGYTDEIDRELNALREETQLEALKERLKRMDLSA